MQITHNTTGMTAGLNVAIHKSGRYFAVVVVKGTFEVFDDSKIALADEQEPLVYADVHYGEPAETSVQYECDFALTKARTDILVNGHAYSPRGRPTDRIDVELAVTLQTGSFRKIVRVFGDRRWESSVLGASRGSPTPFVTLPLIFDRAFGGSDHTHSNPKHQGTELRNPVGRGFHRNGTVSSLVGKSLPNLEDPGDLCSHWSDRPAPVGFGVVGRSWLPRIRYAGTYDAQWLDERFPFLPVDFDERFFQSAPEDQQVSLMKGGEVIQCTNMTENGRFVAEVPKPEIPLRFHFWDRTTEVRPNLDTMIIEPSRSRLIITWRASVALGHKLTDLREVRIGLPPKPVRRSTKPHFRSINEFIRWKKGRTKP